MTHLEDFGLREPPFGRKGRPITFVHYQSQEAAFESLEKVLRSRRSVGLMHGPESSGKSTLIRQFMRERPGNFPVAIVNAKGRKTSKLLAEILAQFGYTIAMESPDELLNMLRVLLVQQARANQSPLLILENINQMYPSALGVICKLAALTIHRRFALRIILTGKHGMHSVLRSPGMNNIAARMTGLFELGPMTSRESMNYLYAKLRACGAERPDNIFPFNTCDKLHLLSGGWPGKLDHIAMAVINRATRLPIQFKSRQQRPVRKEPPVRAGSAAARPPVDAEKPTLIVTCDGRTVQKFNLTVSKSLIGRSAFSDIRIEHEFVSKYHALLVRQGNSTVLIDLRSTNGTLVNSHHVNSKVLRHDDIISLGNHRIKIFDPANRVRAGNDDRNIDETAAMRTITDMRRIKTRRNLNIAGKTTNSKK